MTKFHPLVTFRDPEPKLFMTRAALHRELGPLEAGPQDQQNYFFRAGDTTLIEASFPFGWTEDEDLWCIWESYNGAPGLLFDGDLCGSLEDATSEARSLEAVDSPYPARYWPQKVTIHF